MRSGSTSGTTGQEVFRLEENGDLEVSGQINSENRKHKHYSSLTGSSGDWFPLMRISDDHGGSVLFNINTFAHNSCTFIVSDGYGPAGGTGNPAHISVLNYLHNSNGGYANITGIRVNQIGMVEIRLAWSSGPNVNIDVTAETSESFSYDFESSLATSTSTESIRDTALLENQRARFKKLEVDDRLFTSTGSATAPAICFTDDPDTGIYGASNNHLYIATGSAIRATFNSSGITSAANVYSATTGQFRNYGGTWQATTGTGTNGFTFKNSNEAQTAATITSKGTLNLNGGTTSTRIYLHETYTDAYNYEVTNLEHNSGYFRINKWGGTGTQSGIDLAVGGTSKLKIEPEGQCPNQWC